MCIGSDLQMLLEVILNFCQLTKYKLDVVWASYWISFLGGCNIGEAYKAKFILAGR